MRACLRQLVVPMLIAGVLGGGCAVTPDEVDRPAFQRLAAESTDWFKRRVPGLATQISGSAGYAVFPDGLQWGMLVSGGTYGRGIVYGPRGEQIGWAVINSGSLGLQFGMETFRLLLVFENREALKEFQDNKLFGTAYGVAVADKTASCARAAFDDGIALYEGANEGLMVGANLALNLVRYRPLLESDGTGVSKSARGSNTARRSVIAEAAPIRWPDEHAAN